MKNSNIAWCECGDALEIISIKNKQDIIIDFIYYCFDCDNYYKLVKVEKDNYEKTI